MSAQDVLRAALDGAELRAAVILGTGLGEAAGRAPDDIDIPYADLPGFPRTNVSGHAGRLLLRRAGARYDAFLLGRAHYYEDGDARAMAGAIETLAALGATQALVTCAAGGVRADLAPGRIVALTDHIAFSGRNPLIGLSGDARFTPMNDAYDPVLRAHLRDRARDCGLDLAEGVYMWFSGPSFETPAEVRMAALLGADLVGMSTAPEVILARMMGLRVAALAMVTNHAAGVAGARPDHAETKRVAAAGAQDMRKLIAAYLAQDDHD